ncbi:hypothetical protein EVG80_15585 [Salmonella enterica subsp. enterica serovar Mississippi]|nr:hypothetical protein [Salmonella enterica subsp. enterica serovar Mississippi]
MKKFLLPVILCILAAVGTTIYVKFNRQDTTHTVPLRAVLEDNVLANPVVDAYPTLAEEGFEPVKDRPGVWKRSTDNTTLIIKTRQEDRGEVVSEITVQP